MQFELGRVVCHGIRVDQVDHAYAFMLIMGGHPRVNTAVGGQFTIIREGAQQYNNTTLII